MINTLLFITTENGISKLFRPYRNAQSDLYMQKYGWDYLFSMLVIMNSIIVFLDEF